MSLNKVRWDGIGPELQQILTDNSGEDWLREVAEIRRAADDVGIQMAVDNGNDHVVLTKGEMAAFNQVLAPVVEDWAAAQSGFDADALVTATRQAIANPPGLSMVEEGSVPPRGWILRIIRGWALLGGVLTMGLALMTSGSAVSNLLIGRLFAAKYQLVKHVIAIAIFMFLPYCQITGANVYVDIFTERMGRRQKAAMAVLFSVLGLAFAVLMLVLMARCKAI
ncbi:TRAP transporter small permease subunit [Paracoccus sediminilitoris]|uniref:TRAP transporter small permease subunit n=1 Tax=Paracoccus sediminilitoris TaxID=2202419 RepID=UPI0018F3DE6D|nr:TRAP transporter small permease subunit [Paracoccus sediminilitoris]